MKLNSLAVTEVKGIGEESGKLLNGLGIQTVQDLLEYFPFRYEDYSLQQPTEAVHDERVTMTGSVQSEASIRYYGKKKNRLTFRMLSDGILVTVTFLIGLFLKAN